MVYQERCPWRPACFGCRLTTSAFCCEEVLIETFVGHHASPAPGAAHTLCPLLSAAVPQEGALGCRSSKGLGFGEVIRWSYCVNGILLAIVRPARVWSSQPVHGQFPLSKGQCLLNIWGSCPKLRVPSILHVAFLLGLHVSDMLPLRLQIFVMSSHRIQQRGYDTLFKYTTANPKSAISIFVKKFPAKLQVGLHMSAHISPGARGP